MNYEKTYEEYKRYDQGKKFEDQPLFTMLKEQRKFFDAIKNPNTGEFYQADELLNNPLGGLKDWQPPRLDKKGKSVRYPFEETWEIFRRKLLTGEEVITSRRMMYGLDVLGNERRQAFVDDECFWQVIPEWGQVAENPKENPQLKTTKMKRVITNVNTKTKYTEPFKPETVQKLYDMRNGNKCNLAIIDESNSHPGFGDIPLKNFLSNTFEDLWSTASVPNFKLDRNYGDNLNNTHIG